jgi:hypothetical protein
MVPIVNTMRDVRPIRRYNGRAMASLQMEEVALSMLADKALDFGSKMLGGDEFGETNDMPNDSANHPVARMTFEPSLAPVEGVTYGYPLDERIGERYDSTNAPQTIGELDLTSLCARKHYVGRFSVDLTTPLGEVLFETELSPTAGIVSLAEGAEFQPNLVEYLSLAATMYSFEHVHFTFEMVSSEQTVRLAFMTSYGEFVPPVDETYTQYVQFVDFNSSNRETTIAVPWQSSKSRLRVPKGYDQDRARYALGCFYSRLASSLQTTEVMAPEVDFIVYVSYKGLKLTDFSSGPVDFSPL